MLLLLQQPDQKADETWSPHAFQSSKFAHWFVEEGILIKKALELSMFYAFQVVLCDLILTCFVHSLPTLLQKRSQWMT